MKAFRLTTMILCAAVLVGSAGCHHEHGGTSRVRTLKVDEHGHVHDPNDGHDHGHDHADEKRIASH